MATKPKDTTLRKEKKVTPPSSSHITNRHGIAKPTIQGFSDKDKPTPSGKPIPNYLKPTLSSKTESSRSIKKGTGHEDTGQKATLLRRRSFDKPPSAARLHKSLISPDPKERAASRDRTILPIRSSSFSPKTTSSPKPILDRSSRTLKPVRSLPSTSRTIKRSTSPLRRTGLSAKNESDGSISSKAGPSSHHITQTLDLQIKQVSNEDFLVHGVEESTVNVGTELQVFSDIPKTENEEHIDAVDNQIINVGEDEKLESSDNPANISEGESVSRAAQAEKIEGESHEESGENQPEGEENHDIDGCNNGHPEEGIADEAKVEADQDREEENEKGNVASSEEQVDIKQHEEMEQGDEGREEPKSKEGEDVIEHVEEAKGEASNAAVQRREGGQGKKESPAAYNDVIEETKNKLLEKRKNKVKALVGAFETVIDYESASK